MRLGVADSTPLVSLNFNGLNLLVLHILIVRCAAPYYPLCNQATVALTGMDVSGARSPCDLLRSYITASDRVGLGLCLI